MRVEALAIPDVLLITPKVLGDSRGFFLESWQVERFAAAGIPDRFVQDNHSRSEQGVLRGLHYQIRQPQGKLVRVVAGEVFDVAVDLRQHSPYFGHWVGTMLTAGNYRMLWVPPGFAHGFLVTSQSADLLYKCTDFYAPAQERTLRWDDPGIAVDWPLPAGSEPLLSDKDRAGLTLNQAEVYP